MITKLLILGAGVLVVFVIASILMNKKKKESSDGQGEEYTIANYKMGKNYKNRNMILLSLLLLAVGTWWFLSSRSLKKTTQAKTARKAVLVAREDSTHTQTMRLEGVEEQLIQIRWEDELNNKIMMRNDSSTRSLEYFFKLADHYATYLHFDFGLSESGVAEGDTLVRYNEYFITATAYMNQIFAFIDQLERQAPFYSIETVAFESLPADERGKVKFSLQLRAYFTENGTIIEKIDLENYERRLLTYNPFLPRLHSPITPEEGDGIISLFEIQNGRLIALSIERVFMKDSSSGIIHIFNIGDQVRYGYLENIDWPNQQAVFRINRFGIPEQVRVSLHEKPRPLQSD
ncbi:MAG: hypothetical protein K8R90_11840 [Candidatus Cloacimonetes bacterium]|nr:hypothetical protein [Candidatus Cloacimonadota bacterium]